MTKAKAITTKTLQVTAGRRRYRIIKAKHWTPEELPERYDELTAMYENTKTQLSLAEVRVDALINALGQAGDLLEVGRANAALAILRKTLQDVDRGGPYRHK